MTATEYHIESNYDYISIGHDEYYMSGGGPQAVFVAAGQVLRWHTDDISANPGFTICGALTRPAPFQPPPPRPPLAPPPPPSVPPQPPSPPHPPSPPITFFELPSGSCRYPVTSRDMCADGGVALGLIGPGVAAELDRQTVPYDPPGRYFEGGRLKWNTGTNTGKCNVADICVCIGTFLPPPSPSPAPPPPSPPPPPPPSPSPAPPGGRSLPSVKLTTTIAGSLETFDAGAYATRLASLVGVPRDDVSVSVAATRLRRLQSSLSASLTVTATILARESPVGSGAQVAARIQQTLSGTTAAALSASLGVPVVAVASVVVSATVIYSPPPSMPTPALADAPPPSSTDQTAALTDGVAAQNAAQAARDQLTGNLAAVAIGAVGGTFALVLVVLTVYWKCWYRARAGPRTTTVVTTIHNPCSPSRGEVAMVSTTATSSTALTASMDEPEFKGAELGFGRLQERAFDETTFGVSVTPIIDDTEHAHV